MSLEPFGRRELFAGTGGLFLCTLAGQKVFADRKADVERLAGEVPVPPKVARPRSGPAPRRRRRSRVNRGRHPA